MGRGLEERRRRTKSLALASVLCALGVVLLYVGAVIEVLDMSMVMIASFPIVFAVIELGGAWPWLMYAVTGILGFVLLPSKFPCVMYILFAGFYPIIKEKLEKRLRGFWCRLSKVLVFGVSVTAIFFVTKLFVPDADFGGSIWIWLGMLALTLILYDILLTLLVTKYVFHWRKRFFEK